MCYLADPVAPGISKFVDRTKIVYSPIPVLPDAVDRARLNVPGISVVDGTVDYGGAFDILWVGNPGDGDWPSCSGNIESVIIEPAQ